MTREKALQIDHLLYKIECYEALIEEIYDMQTLDEIRQAYGEDLEPELTAIVQAKLDLLKKELEEL
jgi:LPS sulfotransferase NodH